MTAQPAFPPISSATASTRDFLRARFVIEEVYPTLEQGRYAVKRVTGEPIDVWADIFRDGHDVIAAALVWRREGDKSWHRRTMRLHENDRWTASFVPDVAARYVFAIEAWTDTFASWRRDFLLKREAGQNVDLEAREGRELLADVAPRDREARTILERGRAEFDRGGDPEVLLQEELRCVMAEHQPRPDLTRSTSFPLIIDPPLAGAGTWYEMFPRSQSRIAGRHGTFEDCIARLPELADLGFDVIYFPPIHPIGHTHRKGANNALTAAPGDPGSPYAIGAQEGGHDAVHPELGTLADFRRLVAASRDLGMEIALDFAIQFSPDHPWLAQHPDWFRYRPDGSIRYAENPPKKYQDIVNPDFYCADRAGLWNALRDVVLFWIDQGVRVFRVDNPHTKPFAFWEWLIREVQTRHPGVIFLSEAFTRPKVMKALAKLGFSQSYTYFTWRTTKWDLESYLSELTAYPVREYFRPNFFVNTPDILPFHLQSGDPAVFKSRIALAATLSSSYGVYSGFELIEHTPISGREEYLDSEKYELKIRDWDRPGNIKNYIGRLNRLRRANPALLQTSNLRFALVDDDQVIGFVKESPARGNAVAVAIALSGARPREFWFHLGDTEIGPEGARRKVAAVENLITGERHAIKWGGVRLNINPTEDPALLFRCVGE
jgi:starch synthase (maltosyl-transferring)